MQIRFITKISLVYVPVHGTVNCAYLNASDQTEFLKFESSQPTYPRINESMGHSASRRYKEFLLLHHFHRIFLNFN